MELKAFKSALAKAQEAKGYYFNHDNEHADSVLEQLLLSQARIGYMCCPCRLPAGDRQADSDIICPCAYREADVAEYGCCYCGLYVSKKFNEEKRLPVYVPERRPGGGLL